jgi:gliding motility-associated lipoprotein GldD
MRYFSLILLSLLMISLFSCDEDESDGTPRPRGYFRIDLPEKKYNSYNAECPFSFEIPEYAKMYLSAAPNSEPCWRDLYFGQFRSTLYLSYSEVKNDSMLAMLINQSWELVEAHNKMSMGGKDSTIIRPDAKVYGNVISLGGNAASQMQFYVTDSLHHFLRGSLYFYAAPNKDSIEPVLNYLKKDIFHIVQTLQWKNVNIQELKTTEDSLKAVHKQEQSVATKPKE